MTTFEMIERMRERPGAWLGKKSITLLQAFLIGYSVAETDYNLKKPTHQLFPLNWWFMHEFSKIKCNESSSTAGWCNIILNYCRGDEEAALNKFYEIFDEFKLLKMENGRKAILNKENIYYNDSMKHGFFERYDILKRCSKREYIYINPVAVYIAELSGNNGFLTAIEMEDKIEIEHSIFKNYEKAKEFAENRFGKIENWHNIGGTNIDFNKPVY